MPLLHLACPHQKNRTWLQGVFNEIDHVPRTALQNEQEVVEINTLRGRKHACGCALPEFLQCHCLYTHLGQPWVVEVNLGNAGRGCFLDGKVTLGSCMPAGKDAFKPAKASSMLRVSAIVSAEGCF